MESFSYELTMNVSYKIVFLCTVRDVINVCFWYEDDKKESLMPPL